MHLAILHDFGRAFDKAIVDPGKLPELLAFLAFLGAFGFIRTSAHMIRAQVSWWPGNVSVGDTHVHHLVWGILLLMITGYGTIAFHPGSPAREILAVLFGIGMGLTLDEFALWLNLKDVYWSQKGRQSIDAVIIAAALGGVLLLGIRVWIDLADDVAGAVRWTVAAFGFAGIVVSFVNVLKGKLRLAVVSLLIWPVGIPGLVRLARPTSFWARFYGERRKQRSEQRFAHA